MDYKIVDLGGLKKQLEVTASVQDELVKEKFNSAYSEFQKNAAIPGFRKGKTPIEIVRKRYGEEIESETLPDLVNDIVKGIFEREDTRIAGVIDYNLDPRKPGESLHFLLTYEIVPNVAPEDYKGMKLERAMYRITPEAVDHELFHIREANSEMKEVDALPDKAGIATVDLQVLDDKGVPLIGQRRENYRIDLRAKAPELEEIQGRLLKSKLGDEFQIELEMFDKSNKPTGKKPFRVAVKKLEQVSTPELTDEFAAKVSGGKIETVETLKKDIERDLEHYYEEKAEEELRDEIAQRILARNEFEVPESMVDDYLNDLIEEVKKKSGDQEVDVDLVKERYREASVRAVKWNLLASAIIQKEKIGVDDTVLAKAAEGEAAKYMIDRDKLFDFYKKSDDVKTKLLFNEMFNFIIDNSEVSIVEKTPTHQHED